jgi:hypothetical protein
LLLWGSNSFILTITADRLHSEGQDEIARSFGLTNLTFDFDFGFACHRGGVFAVVAGGSIGA